MKIQSGINNTLPFNFQAFDDGLRHKPKTIIDDKRYFPIADPLTVKPFLQIYKLNLPRLLKNAPSDEKTQKELKEVLKIQQSASQQQIDRAIADNKGDFFSFADVIGEKFNKDNFPKAASLGQDLFDTSILFGNEAKEHWFRQRPFQLDTNIKALVKASPDVSYPSGHAASGMLFGLVLADIFPEKRKEILKRAKEYGDNRVIVGVHYPSDVEAGRKAGELMYKTLQGNKEYRESFAAAKEELRAALTPTSKAQISPSFYGLPQAA